MLKVKKNMFLTVIKNGCIDDESLNRIEEMEEKFFNMVNKSEDTNIKSNNDDIHLGKRYFEYTKEQSNTTGEKFKLITQEELSRKKVREIC